MNQDEYQMVGVDADGQPLYRKVDRASNDPANTSAEPSASTNQGEKSRA